MPQSAQSNEVRIPVRMAREIEEFRHALRAEASSRRLDTASLDDFARFVVARGVAKWGDLDGYDYEAYLRSIAPAEWGQEKAEVKRAVAQADVARRFVDHLATEEVIEDSPANAIHMTVYGSVRKPGVTNEDVDEPVQAFLSRRRRGNDPLFYRSKLREFVGHMAVGNLRRWRDVKPEHVVSFLQKKVSDQALVTETAHLSLARDSHAAIDAFLDFAKKRGVVDKNVAEHLIITSDGRIFSGEDIPERMQSSVDRYVEESGQTEQRKVMLRQHLRELMIDACANFGVKSWSDLRPAHYEEFLRRTWTKWHYMPEFAQRRLAQTKRFLAAQLARPPSEGFDLSSTGILISPLRANPERLPERMSASEHKWHKASEIPAPFRKDAVRHWKRQVDGGQVATRRHVEALLLDAGKHFHAMGLKDWTAIRVGDIDEYGRRLLAERSSSSSSVYFHHLTRFFEDLESHGVRKDDPTVGFKMTAQGRWDVPPPVAHTLVAEMDDHLWNLHPRADEGRSRRAYRDALMPLMGFLTKRGVEHWVDVEHATMKDYVGHMKRNFSGYRQLHHHRAIRSFFAEVFAGKEENPAKGILPTSGRNSEHYRQMMEPDEVVMRMPKRLRPPVEEEPDLPSPPAAARPSLHSAVQID